MLHDIKIIEFEAKEIITAASSHLAEQPIVIGFRDRLKALGPIYKTDKGQTVIDIPPVGSDSELLEILLFELAKVRLGPGGGESKARELAEDWLNYANENHGAYWSIDRAKMECKLLALLDWRAGG